MDVSSPQTLTRVSEVVNGRGRERVASAIAAARDLLGMEMAFVSQLTPDEQIYRFVGGDTESFGMSEGHVGASDCAYPTGGSTAASAACRTVRGQSWGRTSTRSWRCSRG
jgi:hypothetical protein